MTDDVNYFCAGGNGQLGIYRSLQSRSSKLPLGFLADKQLTVSIVGARSV
jgi:hypothetical protein